MRKQAIALLFFGSTAWAQLAHGLGLGDIEVYSALNQALEAEINLTSVRPDELDGLIVKLASEEAFSQAGVERPFYLTRLKFSLASKPDGTQYIKVSTEDPVREPFLSFLIDVDWPRGRLVREYTVLLDPPVFASQPQAVTPQITSAPAADTLPETATGEPALIERTPATAETGDFDFGVEEEGGEAAESTGFDELPSAGESVVGTESLVDDLPDIEVEQAPAEEVADSTGAAEEPTVDQYEAETEVSDSGDETLASQEAAPEFEDETLTTQSSTAGSFEEEQFTDADEEGEPLPDIDIVLDESLPYDEVATNALLAQFAAEDSVKDSAVGSQNTAPMGAGKGGGSGDGSGVDEYKVKAGDTLHEIASQYKPADVSVNQAMLAMLRYNPNAFIRGNINDVKKGFVLRMPDKSAMLEMDNAEALAEVRRQTALWREYKSQLVGAASATRDAQSADTFQSTKIDTGAQSERGELSILSPGRDDEASSRAAGQQEGVATDSGALQRDLQLAREQLAAERLEKVELQERLTELNNQLETMERLITLKNEQLAQLQQQLGERKAETGKPAALPVPGEQAGEKNARGDKSPTLTTEPESEQDKKTAIGTGDSLGLTLGDEAAGSTETELDLLGETKQKESAKPATESRSSQEDTGPEQPLENNASPADANAPASGNKPAPVDKAEGSSPPAAEQAKPPAGQPGKVKTPVTAPAPPKHTGISGWVYDHLPSPYNIMLADALESPIGLPVLGAIAVVLLLIVLGAVKSKGKGKAKTKSGKAKQTEAPSTTQTLKTKAVKPPLGQRLKAMFAPLSGLFTSSKKSSLISIMSDGAGAGAKQEEPAAEEKAVDNTDDEETDSFDETVMVAAVAVKNDANKKGVSPQPAQTPQAASAPAPKAETVEPEEEVADDTTAEADVYLAYGLFDQAEELLTQALAGNPGKMEYKGKLLETYFAAGKKTEFEKLAASLHSDLKGKPSRIWDKALVMGKEIAPANSLFSGAADTELKISDFAPAKPETADLDLSSSQGETTPDIEFGDDDDESSTTDFDLDLGEDDNKLEETVINPGNQSDGDLAFELNTEDAADELSIDFNADELGLGADLTDAPAIQPEELNEDSESDMSDATVAIDLGFDLPDETGNVDVDMDLSDLDISGIEDDVESDHSASDELIAELDSNESQDVSVNTEFEILDDDTIIDSELDDDTFGGDSSLDEVATKLDLAKAYMDMGDYDGASSTLEEVLAEGSESQRQEAEELLDQIN